VLVNTRRRVIAASTSILLLLGLFAIASSPAHAATSGTISGKVFDPDGRALPSAKITVFSHTGAGWELWEEVVTSKGTSAHPELAGTFSLTVPPGSYRVAFGLGLNNELKGGGTYVGQYYPDVTSIDTATDLVITEGSSRTGVNATLRYSGGTISGTVRDAANKPLGDVEVQGYNADRTYDDDPATNEPNLTTTTDAAGHYTLRTSGVPIKLHFLQDSGGYLPAWYGTTPSYADAATLSADAGESVTVNDVTLDPLPLVNRVTPQITGDLFVGGTARADEGEWSSHDATYKYQWYRILSSGTELKLTPATHQTYKLNSHDYGHQLRVVVTASQAGTPSVAAKSGKSRTAKLGSSVSFSGSSSSPRAVKVHATVRKSTGSRASGKIRFSCGTSHVTFAGHTMTLKSGKASTTLKHVPKGRFTCTAKYYGTSTVAGKIKTDRVTVK
jgi:hypothetical protein